MKTGRVEREPDRAHSSRHSGRRWAGRQEFWREAPRHVAATPEQAGTLLGAMLAIASSGGAPTEADRASIAAAGRDRGCARRDEIRELLKLEPNATCGFVRVTFLSKQSIRRMSRSATSMNWPENTQPLPEICTQSPPRCSTCRRAPELHARTGWVTASSSGLETRRACAVQACGSPGLTRERTRLQVPLPATCPVAACAVGMTQ